MSASAPQPNAAIVITWNDISKDPFQLTDSTGNNVVAWISYEDGKWHNHHDGSGILPTHAAILKISASSAISGQNGVSLHVDCLDLLDSKGNVVGYIDPEGNLGGSLA